MADSTPTPAEGSELMDIGTVAAHNIAQAIGAGEDKVIAIRDAIRNEIQVMSSHFTSAVADVQTHFEVEKNKLEASVETTKSALIAQAKIDVDAFKAKLAADYSFLADHKLATIGVLVAAIVVGALFGRLV